MTNAAAKKFTARNLPALEKLATECGLKLTHKNWSKCVDFAPGDLVERANSMFGDREYFFASNRWRFARVSWERDTRTESQKNNCD